MFFPLVCQRGSGGGEEFLILPHQQNSLLLEEPLVSMNIDIMKKGVKNEKLGVAFPENLHTEGLTRVVISYKFIKLAERVVISYEIDETSHRRVS